MKKLTLLSALVFLAMQAFGQTYCTTGLYSTGCTYGDDLDSVSINNMQQSPTGCSSGGYADYTGSDTIVYEQLTNIELALTSGYSNQYYAMWIDMNSDGDFDDANEFIWASTTASLSAGSVASYSTCVPSLIPQGTYRLRLRGRYSSPIASTGSCTNYVYGEVHDYTVQVVAPPTCVPATCVSLVSTTDTSATLSWNGNSSSYQIEYGLNGFSMGSGLTTTSSANTVTIYGLSANTVYNFYVRADCGSGSYSTWSGVVTGQTVCAPYTTASGYSDDFDGYTSTQDTIQCWTFLTTSTTASFNARAPYSWEPSAVSSPNVGSIYNSNATYAVAISPMFSDLPADTGRVRFKIATPSTSKVVYVGTMPSNTSTANFHPIDTLTITPTWQNITLYMDNVPAGDYYFAIQDGMTALYSYTFIDDFVYDEIPDCPEAIMLSSSNITDSSAVLSWTSGSAGPFTIEWGPTGFVQGTGNFDTVYTGNSINLLNLAGNTGYDFYVQVDCGGLGTSAWSDVATFVTECNAININSGYFNNFDTDSLGMVPTCWKETTNGFGFFEVQASSTWTIPAFSGSRFATLYDGGASITIGISPLMTDLDQNVGQVEFRARQLYTWATASMIIGTMMGNDEATFVAVDTVTPTSSSWDKYVVRFDNVPSGHNKVGFKHIAGGSYSYACIDNFYYNPIPSCLPPTNLGQGSATTTSADVYFTSGGAPYAVIAWGPVGFNPATGAPMGTMTVSNDSATINGLVAASCYDVWIADSCSGALSPWEGPLTVCTELCNDPCQYTIQMFDSWGDGWNGGYVEVTVGGFTTQYTLTTGTSGIANFSVCDGLSINMEWFAGNYVNEVSFNVLDANGTNVYTQALSPSGPPTGSAFYTGSGSCPSCIPTTGLMASNVDMTSFDVEWTAAGSPIGYYVSYGPTGFTAGSGTQIMVSGGDTTLTGLTASTCYDVYVQKVCAVGDSAIWTGPINVCTNQCYVTDQCYYTVYMYDSYGDGWNGGYISLIQDSIAVANIGTGFTTGTYMVDSVAICPGYMSFFTSGNSGGWPSEVGFDIVAPWGDTIASNPTGSGFATGTVYFAGLLGCTPPACSKPKSISATGNGVSSIDLSWTSGNTGASGWEIEYGPAGFLPGNGMVTSSTSNSLTLNGLDTATCYDFWIREACPNSVGDTSFWAGPISACTDACLPSQMCTFALAMNTSNNWGWDGAEVEIFQNGISAGTFGLNFTSGSQAYDSIALCDNAVIEFVVIDGGWSSFSIGLDVIDANGDTVFTYPTGWGFIDGMSLGTYTSSCDICAMPSAFVAVNNSCDELELEWSVDAGATTTIEYGMSGFTPGSGTTVTSTSGMATLTGLTGGTSYDVYAQATCTSGTTSWVGPIAFTTATSPLPSVAPTYTVVTITPNAMTFDANSTGATSVTWTFSDGSTGTGETVSHNFTTSGSAYAVVTATNGCGSVSDTVNFGIGFDELALVNDVKLYPNPSNGKFNLSFTMEENGPCTIEMIDMRGAIIRSQHYDNAEGQVDVEYNLTETAAGVYHVRITTSHGSVTLRAIIE